MQPAVCHNSGTYTSPGTPNYWDSRVEVHKGWSSERVPLPTSSSRSHISASALMPFNSGRTLPSKWEDAERWITSPVSGNGTSKTLLAQPQRRPKSKSGPLGHPGNAGYSNYSPAMPLLECGNVRNFMLGSPFSTGVMFADSLSFQYGGGTGGQSHTLHPEHSIARSVSVPAWSEALGKSSLPSSQEDKLDSPKDAENLVSHVASRRDMATQMSPKGSNHSSSGERSPLSPSSSSLLPISESQSDHSGKLEIRDVEVDKRATMIRWSKKHGARISKKGTSNIEDLYRNATEARASSWDIAEAAKNLSKYEREEAKITAWENLQKAKAEAAIRKLEMKLEKKRSSSMDKILNKLRMAQIKAQEMRSSISDTQVDEVPKTSHKIESVLKNVRMGSLGGCFTCRAF